MPRRRANPQLGDLVDQVVDTAVDGLFDRFEGFVDRVRNPAPAPATPIQQAPPVVTPKQARVCAACRGPFLIEQMEMIHPSNGFGLCQKCFGFMWNAAKAKIMEMRANAPPQAARPADPPRPAQTPPRTPLKPPYEVLGISQDASITEIKKAYRRLAMEYHPDRVPSDASTEEKEHAKRKYDEVSRAYKVMMSVRSAPEK